MTVDEIERRLRVAESERKQLSSRAILDPRVFEQRASPERGHRNWIFVLRLLESAVEAARTEKWQQITFKHLARNLLQCENVGCEY